MGLIIFKIHILIANVVLLHDRFDQLIERLFVPVCKHGELLQECNLRQLLVLEVLIDEGLVLQFVECGHLTIGYAYSSPIARLALIVDGFLAK